MPAAIDTRTAPDPHLPPPLWLAHAQPRSLPLPGMAGFLVGLDRAALAWLADAAITAMDALDGDCDAEPETVEHGEAA